MRFKSRNKKFNRRFAPQSYTAGLTPTPFPKKGVGARSEWGFTIIELTVALGLFTVVMLISVGALLSIVDANRKVRALGSVMDNLSFAIENMSRSIRVGDTYHCGTSGSIVSPRNCSNGDSFFAFEATDGDPGNSGDQIVFRLNGNQIEKSTDSGSTYLSITAPEIVIDSGTGLQFYVVGTSSGDNRQPRVIMVIRGQAGVKTKEISRFEIQTTISQRSVDS